MIFLYLLTTIANLSILGKDQPVTPQSCCRIALWNEIYFTLKYLYKMLPQMCRREKKRCIQRFKGLQSMERVRRYLLDLIVAQITAGEKPETYKSIKCNLHACVSACTDVKADQSRTYILRNFLYGEKALGGISVMPFCSSRLRAIKEK